MKLKHWHKIAINDAADTGSKIILTIIAVYFLWFLGLDWDMLRTFFAVLWIFEGFKRLNVHFFDQ